MTRWAGLNAVEKAPTMSAITKLRTLLAARRVSSAAKRDALERSKIAKTFNARYCYRLLYDQKAPILPGTALGGFLPTSGHRWMCPDCNNIHAPTECSFFSGLQYPACCITGFGHRL